jgi:predicted nuclease of restriction endonuclease-like RecB superfamily
LGFDLCAEDGLTSHLPPPDEFDSHLEEDFARKWGTEPRDGWQLEREGEILHNGQKVFVPDFVLRHEDGRVVLMEVIGFWTPEYLAAKAATLRAFGRHSILLAVADPLRQKLPDLPQEAVCFKSVLKVQNVLARLAKCVPSRSPR